MAQQIQEEKNNLETQNSKANFAMKDLKVMVCVRKKPVDKAKDVILAKSNTITVQNNKLSYSLEDILYSHRFQFDRAYGEKATNLEIFRDSIESMVEHTLSGGISSVVAYGQTGTGKTYSLLAPYNGIIFESIKCVLQKGFKGSISFLEIYLGNVQDCLRNKAKLNIFEKEGCIYASELLSKPFETFEEAINIIADGLKNRTTSATDTNVCSSRSHAVLFIDCYKTKPDVIDGARKLASNSTFILVDLAGSERGNDRKSCSREAAAEGAEINKSLLALKECIRGIEMKSKFLPFRQCKLTQLLKNSFIGESKLFFLATISASSKDVEHTLNTLRYAIRIKESKLCSAENNDYEYKISDEEKLQGEHITIEKLGKELNNHLEASVNKTRNDSTIPNANHSDSPQSSYSILTSDEIDRLKDLSLDVSVRNDSSRFVMDKTKIKNYINEISSLVEKKKDSAVLKEILKDLENVVFRLKNVKN